VRGVEAYHLVHDAERNILLALVLQLLPRVPAERGTTTGISVWMEITLEDD
jgi:hypothetical protein